jgi:hypothetical protein
MTQNLPDDQQDRDARKAMLSDDHESMQVSSVPGVSDSDQQLSRSWRSKRRAARRSRRRTLFLTAALLAVISVGIFIVRPQAVAGRGSIESEEAQIRRVVAEFSAAVDAENGTQMGQLLCAEEANVLAQDDDYDEPTDANVGGTGLRPVDVVIIEVQVDGPKAVVQVQRQGGQTITLGLTLERGNWKVCTPANRVPSVPTPTPS